MGSALAGIGVSLFFWGLVTALYVGQRVEGFTFICTAAVVFMLAAIVEHEHP